MKLTDAYFVIDTWQRRFEAGKLPRGRFIVALALERVDMTICRGTDAELSDLREVVEVAWALLKDEPSDEEGIRPQIEPVDPSERPWPRDPFVERRRHDRLDRDRPR